MFFCFICNSRLSKSSLPMNQFLPSSVLLLFLMLFGLVNYPDANKFITSVFSPPYLSLPMNPFLLSSLILLFLMYSPPDVTTEQLLHIIINRWCVAAQSRFPTSQLVSMHKVKGETYLRFVKANSVSRILALSALNAWREGGWLISFEGDKWLLMSQITVLMKHNDHSGSNYDTQSNQIHSPSSWWSSNLSKSLHHARMANIHSHRSLEQLQLTLNLTQELEAAGSKVLVYLPDGGDCSSKDECAARFLIHILDPFPRSPLTVSLSPSWRRGLCKQKGVLFLIVPFTSSLNCMP